MASNIDQDVYMTSSVAASLPDDGQVSQYSKEAVAEYCRGLYDRTETGQTIYIIVLVAILVFGVIANTAVLSLVAFVQELRNPSNVFISMLCGSNILMLVTILPFELAEHDSFKVAKGLAGFKHYMLLFFCSISILSLVMLSFERWCAVVRPIWPNVVRIGWKVAIVLILGVLLPLPHAFTFVAEPNYQYFQYFLNYYTLVVLYAVPLVIICCMYISVAKKLCMQSKLIKESMERNPKARVQRNRVALVVMALVVSFAVCWLPFHLSVFFDMFQEHFCAPGQHTVFMVRWRVCFYMLNTCCDPMSIFLLGSRFRRHLLSALSHPFHKLQNQSAARQTQFGSYSNLRSGRSTSATVIHMKSVDTTLGGHPKHDEAETA
ncbi:gastrin-releasing peptide receptor-like [Apostichopus japonicus]|uniref:gastrin-releasing peptide receptor-like n=1 Tax=Stichopus japonicus TaxID=307972 RepID=UPI003AB482C2